MYDFHWSNAKYMNPSRATIPLIRPHQCDSDGGRIRGVLLHFRKARCTLARLLTLIWVFLQNIRNSQQQLHEIIPTLNKLRFIQINYFELHMPLKSCPSALPLLSN